MHTRLLVLIRVVTLQPTMRKERKSGLPTLEDVIRNERLRWLGQISCTRHNNRHSRANLQQSARKTTSQVEERCDWTHEETGHQLRLGRHWCWRKRTDVELPNPGWTAQKNSFYPWTILQWNNLYKATTIICIITAELDRALAVVKVTLQVNGNSQFWGSASPPQKKTIGAIKIKSGTNYYVVEGTHMQNLATVESLGAAPHMGEI